MMANWQPEYQSSCPVSSVDNKRFSGVVIKHINGSGISDMFAGVIADDSVAGVWSTSVTESRYKSNVSIWKGNASCGHPQPGKTPSPRLQLLTPLATRPSRVGGDSYTVWFANAGLADGEVTLVKLDDGLAVVGGASAWPLSKMSPPMSIAVTTSPSGGAPASTPRCGVLAIAGQRSTAETFCIALAPEE